VWGVGKRCIFSSAYLNLRNPTIFHNLTKSIELSEEKRSCVFWNLGWMILLAFGIPYSSL
jgi:hypothetical protein